MNTTVRLRAADIVKEWHVVDAAGKPLGRVASEVAVLLRGKHKPTFEPHLDMGDFVIVINAAKVALTGRKAEQRRYYWHSGYPGGIKERTWTEQMERDPARVIEQAVWGMLPKNRLGRRVIRHLKVYSGADHPHDAQVTGSERAAEQRAAEGAHLPRRRRFAIPLTRTHLAGAATAAGTSTLTAEAPAAAPVAEEEPAPVAAPEEPAVEATSAADDAATEDSKE